MPVHISALRLAALVGALSAVGAMLLLLACRGSYEARKTVPRPRLISLSPGVTEIVHGVGAFSSLVAVSEFCDFPEETKRLPRVGGFLNVNLEAIASLSPDIVILTDAQAPFFKDKLGQMGLGVLVVKDQSIADIIETIRLIGRETGQRDQGERLADGVRRRIDERSAETAGLPRPRVLCVIDRMPGTLKDLHAASKNSFIDEIIAASGGENIAPPAALGYSKLQQEAVGDANPQIIIDIVHRPSAERMGDPRAVWQALRQIEAVRSGNIAIVSELFVAHPSQRIVETLALFSRIIHPEVFGPYGK